MKIFAIGDLHLKKSWDYLPLLDELVLQIERCKPDMVVVLGDTLDTKSVIHMTCLVDAINFFDRLSKLAKTYVLIGNHDRLNNSDFLSEYHPFTAVKSVTIADRVIKEDGFVFVPYVPPGMFDKALGDTDLSDVKLIFAHQQFLGSVPDGKGDVWSMDKPMVISGHIHSHMFLENIMYTGSPVAHTFGEKSDKFVFLLDATGAILEKISLECYKPRRELHFDVDDIKNLDIDEVADEKYNTKVVITMTRSETKAYANQKTIKELKRKLGRNFHINCAREVRPDNLVESDRERSFESTVLNNLGDDVYAIDVFKRLLG